MGFAPTTGTGIATVDSAEGLEGQTLRFGLAFDFAHGLLHTGGSDRADVLAVERMGVVHASAAWGLWDFLELGLAFPLAVHTAGEAGVGAPEALSGVAPGDLRVVPKLSFGSARASGWKLALLAVFSAPTGDASRNAGERGLTFAPELAASYRFAQGSEVVINFGYRARPSLPFGRLLVDDQVTFGLGVQARLWEGLSLLGEVTGAIGVRDNPADPHRGVDAAEVPVEALGAFEVELAGGFGARLGAAAGLTSGWGAPDYRAFVALSYLVDLRPPPDRDGDGVVDGDDACPDAAEDADGQRDGDGCPDPDDDGDGRCDAHQAVQLRAAEFAGQCGGRDRCPAAAEDEDGFEDEDGCPDPDNDGDGVLDAADRCPGEPETANGHEDDDGCPDSSEVVLTDQGIELNDAIYFFLGRAEIEAKSEPLLAKIAALMLANPQVTRVRVEGHTDNQGPAAVNLALSKARARAVVLALVARGVAAERLESEGYGATRPVCREHNVHCWAKNRRTEFRLVTLNGRPLPSAGE